MTSSSTFDNASVDITTSIGTSTSTNPSLAAVIHYPKPNDSEVLRLLEKYPLVGIEQYSYGTAGFRYKATVLAPIMVRVGIVAAIQAVQVATTTGGSDDDNDDDNDQNRHHSIGVMITASHNDETYNGVKFAQSPTGGMMDSSGEQIATYIVNERDNIRLWEYVTTIRTQKQLQNKIIVVHIGYDTREHSPSLTCLVRTVALAMGCMVYDHGIITTPMLHHCVKHYTPQYIPSLIPSRPGLYGYYDLLLNSYRGLLQTKTATTKNTMNSRFLYVDCACGVGYIHLQYLANENFKLDGGIDRSILHDGTGSSNSMLVSTNTTTIVPFNPPGSGPLNIGCGSEYVQKELHVPHWYDIDGTSTGSSSNDKQQRQWDYCASLDGDADRIVFFYSTSPTNNNTSNNSNNELRLLDGDKIAALICQFIQQELSIVQQQTIASTTTTNCPTIRLGVVQTAYANGASTSFLRSIVGNDNVLIAKTGVKYVHEMAHEHFDIGIYFEANGHGTILFGSNFYQYMYCIEQVMLLNGKVSVHQRTYQAFQRLRLLPALVNQAVGDAISDLLLIDAILQIQNLSIQEWDTSMYIDLPSRQGKVQVHDRTIIQTNINETKCIEPIHVQSAIDTIVQTYNNKSSSTSSSNSCRAFIRPSGTEDVVRIYAEGPTREIADELATEIMNLVYDTCGGIGTRPLPFVVTPQTSKM